MWRTRSAPRRRPPVRAARRAAARDTGTRAGAPTSDPNLYIVLRAACPAGYEVFLSPVDWRPDRRTSQQPDLLVVRNEDVATQNITAPLVLAVEVLSPSTRRKDLLLKRSKYEESGVRSYWVVDPAEPSLLALDLQEGAYVTTAHARAAERAALATPFPVDVVPAELVRPAP
ncbi:Uma2 family endonuclease [Georgenia sp. Marseille-Q6866]